MKNILIVEDDRWLAEHFARILEGNQREITICRDGQVAIDIIDQNLPDLIVLDILLSGSTAFGLLHELQSYGDTSKLPIIICSNLVENMNDVNLGQYGVVKVLNKATMQPGDLVLSVSAILNENE